MSVGRYVFIYCDVDGCDEEVGPSMWESETRRMARSAGWRVGRNRNTPDYCPAHRSTGHL